MREIDDITLYARWLKGGSRDRPDYVTRHMVARFLRVPVWELKYVPIHYVEEAVVILRARYEAQLEIASKNKCSPEKIILPDF